MAEVLVVGAGPAGCCAAWTCARGGLETLLLTDSLDTVFHGAPPQAPLEWPERGEGLPQLLQEPEVSGLRGRELQRQVRWLLEQQPGLHLLQASAAALLVEDGNVRGVRSWEGPEFEAGLVALCVGSFLDASLEQASLREQAGKPGQMSYRDLALDLAGYGLRLVPAEYAFSSDAGPGTVRSLVFAADQLKEGHWLPRPVGLSAAGYVVDPDMDFVAAALSGQSLGEALLERCKDAEAA